MLLSNQEFVSPRHLNFYHNCNIQKESVAPQPIYREMRYFHFGSKACRSVKLIISNSAKLRSVGDAQVSWSMPKNLQAYCSFLTERISGAHWVITIRLWSARPTARRHPSTGRKTATPRWCRMRTTRTPGAFSSPCWAPCSQTSTPTPVRAHPGRTYWTSPSPVRGTLHRSTSSLFFTQNCISIPRPR